MDSNLTMWTVDCIIYYPLPAYRLYPILGNDSLFYEFLDNTPQVWPPWWRRMLQRWLLGWRWVRVWSVGNKDNKFGEGK